MKKHNIYLDHASTAPLLPEALEAMHSAASQYYANPSALHEEGLKVKSALTDFRGRAAKILSVKPDEIIFTAGATEANNIFIQGVLKSWPGSHVLVSPLEHDAIANIPGVEQWSPGAKLSDLSDAIVKASDDNTVAISSIYVNNETGSVQNIKQVVEAANMIQTDRASRGILTPCYVHVDAAQAFTAFKITPKDLGIDAVTCNGSKIGGPKQSGCLYLSRTAKIKPIMFGGSQERSLRPGTEAVHQVAGFVSALEQAQSRATDESKRLSTLQASFERDLKKLNAKIVSEGTQRSPHISSVLFPGYDNETLAIQLSSTGVYVSAGSACHAGTGNSKVLSALGYSDEDSRSVLRFSYGYETSATDLKQVVKTISELL